MNSEETEGVQISLNDVVFCHGKEFARVNCMLDFLAIAATLIFFLISLAYVRGCEKL